MYQRGLNGDRLFHGEFALRVTVMKTSDPEEFFGYFRMDRTAFDEFLYTPIHFSQDNAQKPHLTGRTADHHTEVVLFFIFSSISKCLCT